MNVHRHLSLVALAAALSGGCGSDGALSGFAVRDSAGVMIAENTAPVWEEGSAWRLSAEPALEIGVFEGAPEYQLFRVAGALRLADGRIAVANSGTHELRFYSADGTYLSATGREGEGPGEFKGLAQPLLLAPDSLLVWDWSIARASIFDDDGTFARSSGPHESLERL